MAGLATGNGQALYSHRGCVDSVAEFQIVGGRERGEHVVQVPGYSDFAHRITAFALLDPKAGSAAAVVAGNDIGAGADQVGDIEALIDIRDQLLGGRTAG